MCAGGAQSGAANIEDERRFGQYFIASSAFPPGVCFRSTCGVDLCFRGSGLLSDPATDISLRHEFPDHEHVQAPRQQKAPDRPECRPAIFLRRTWIWQLQDLERSYGLKPGELPSPGKSVPDRLCRWITGLHTHLSEMASRSRQDGRSREQPPS